MTIDERVKRFLASRKTAAQRRRMRQRLNREFGKAQTLRGAAKSGKLKKLYALLTATEL